MRKVPGSGRKAGVPNKKTTLIADVAERLGVNPFEVLCRFAGDDWEGLGIEPIRKSMPSKPDEVEGQNDIFLSPIPMEVRMHAAKEACKYLYPQRKAVTLSTDEESGFRIVIEDYVSKEKK